MYMCRLRLKSTIVSTRRFNENKLLRRLEVYINCIACRVKSSVFRSAFLLLQDSPIFQLRSAHHRSLYKLTQLFVLIARRHHIARYNSGAARLHGTAAPLDAQPRRFCFYVRDATDLIILFPE